jgi:hypothetical protein
MGKYSLEGAVALVAGLAALLAPELWGDKAGLMPLMVLGALLALSGLYALASVAGVSDWTTTAFAVLIFVSPWAFAYDGSNKSAWTAWIAGGLATIVGLWTAYQARSKSAG